MFLIHPADGNVFCYAELARQMGNDQPFYGLQAFGTEPGTLPLMAGGHYASDSLEVHDIPGVSHFTMLTASCQISGRKAETHSWGNSGRERTEPVEIKVTSLQCKWRNSQNLTDTQNPPGNLGNEKCCEPPPEGGTPNCAKFLMSKTF